jgi:hypothetical protein
VNTGQRENLPDDDGGEDADSAHSIQAGK